MLLVIIAILVAGICFSVPAIAVKRSLFNQR